MIRFKYYVVFLTVGCSLLFSTFALATDEDDLYNRGFTLWQQQNWNQAITELETFIQRYPNSSRRNDAELYVGHSYLSRNNFVNTADGVTGRQHLDFIIKQGRNAKDYKDACLHYAFSLYSLMNFNEAQPRLAQYVSEFPKDDSLQYTYYYLGMCELHFGNYTKAEEWFTRDLTEFPNGALKAECQLDRAVAVGKSGRYADADRMLSDLAINPDFKFSHKAYLQRAYLKIDQQNYTEALQILESFVARTRNVQGAQAYIAEAYQYEAHCYIEQGNYDAAYRTAEEIEKLTGATPDSALLKIKILTKLERFAEAEALLTQLKNSQFRYYAGDVITYYESMLSLARGQWDVAINQLIPLLKVQYNQQQQTVTFGYYDNSSETQTKLRPSDFLESCGVLVLSYASRYGATKQYPDDNVMQKAVFDAMYRYASDKTDLQLMNIVKETDTARNMALQKPIQPKNPQGTLVVNGGGPTGTNYPQNNVPGQAGSGWPNSSGTTAGNNPGGMSYPGSLPGSADQGGRPNGPGSATGFPNSGFNTPTQAGSNLPNANQNAGASLNKKISESDASSILTRAGTYCMNSDFNRANELLLELLTSSETFWQDCPTIAPAVALMRANILFKIRNFREAQAMCNLLIKEAPNSQQAVNANYYLGYCYDYYAQQDKAIECFEKVVNSKYESNFTDDAYYYLGMNQWERKNPLLAEDCFKKIYRSYKTGDYWGHAVWAYAQIEFEGRNYEAAERLVNEALADKPDKSIIDWLLFLKGEIAIKNKDYEKARIAFNSIVTQYPESTKITMARNRLANLPKATSSAPDQF